MVESVKSRKTSFIAKFHICSRQVHVMTTYVLEAFSPPSKKIDMLKQNYTAQRKLHKLSNIWGKLL